MASDRMLFYEMNADLAQNNYARLLRVRRTGAEANGPNVFS